MLFPSTMLADSFTITFKDSGVASDGTNGLSSTTISDYVSDGADYVSAISASGKVFNAQTGYGLKFGNSSSPGSITLTLKTPIKPSSIVMNASQYGASEGTGLLQADQYDMTGGGGKGKFNDYTKEYDGNTEVTTIVVGTQAKRGYVKSVTINYGAAEPEPEPYVVDFNKTIAVPTGNTNTPDFAVSVGWARKAQSATGDGYGPYYMMYTYSSTLGVDGTGTLGANAQQAPQSTYDGTISKVNDYIITPKVSGTVTLQVKGNSSASSTYPSEIKFFAIDDDATTVGDEIVATFSDNISATSWVTATLTLTEATRLAIKAQWVYMDNFTATTAEVPEVKSITVLKVADQINGNEGSTGVNPKFEQLADGNMLVKLKVTLQNTGNVALTTASDGFTLTPAWATYSTGTKTYFEDAKVTIPEDLAIDETKTFDIDFTVPYTYGTNGYIDWFVKENVSGTTSSSYRYAQSIPYEPKFVFRVFEGTATASLTTAQDYGLVNEETTKQFEIYNDGAAPLIIKSITLPEGFTSANAPVIPTEGLSIAKFSKQALDITLPTTASGAVGGNLVIVYLDKEGAEQTYQLAFSGKMLDASKWMAAFDSDNWSNPTWPEGTVHLTNIKGGYQYVSTSNYNWWLTTGGSGSGYKSNNWFITPKLHATAGEKFSFDVKRNSSTGDYYVKVYLSTDRKTWGEPVKTIANSELTSDFQSFFIEAAAEGDYYVGFEIYYVAVDNLFGFAPVEGITHDIYLVKSTLPTETQSGKKITPSMEIIPVIAETADAYSVKYYVNGTAVATAESTDLTAGSNKTFSIEYIPEVEATTEFTTYIAMELTDGTVLAKSDEATLTVTKEPKFLFVTASTSISQYTTSVTAAQAFGKVNTATEKKSFKIANNGTAVLKVKSITAPEGFQASVAGPVEVAAGETLDVDITFNAATPGAYSGNLAIVYEKDAAGTEDTYELAFSGTMLDPAKFYATFGTTTDLSNLPAGSLIQGNISLTTATTDNACLSSSSSTKNLFITPLLDVAEASTIEFSARKRSSWYDPAVYVYAVTDHLAAAAAETDEQFEALEKTQLKFAEPTSTSTFELFTVEVPAGTKYLAFKIENAYVDDIYGLKVASVAHEWQIASSNIPAEAMQNVAKTVSVNILNIGQQAEAADGYTMTVFVDGAAVATGETVALPMNHKLTDAGTQISASFRYPKVGTFPVYIEVKAGEYSVATEPVHVTFTEEAAVAEAIEVGTKSGADKSHGPVDWYNNDGSGTNWTDIVYTAKQLDDFGIKAGDKITSIAFKGSGTAKSIKAAITSWVGVKTGDITPGTVDKDAMTEVVVYDQADAAATIDFSLFNIDLSSNPIVWDGTSDIRIYTEAIRQGSNNWQTVTYDYDSNYMNSYFKSTTAVATPLGYFTLAAEPAVFSGTVKTDTGTAVEGATITLVSTDGDNVQYTGATDAEGAYSINVIQANRTYDVTMKAEGYDDQVVTIEFNGESQTKNFVVSNGSSFDPTTAIANADFEGEFTVYSSPNTDRDIHQPAGWTINYENSNENDMTALNSSCKAWNNFSGRPQLTTGGNNTYWVRFRWGNNENLTMSQVVTLPAGEYRMTADAFFNGANGGSATISAAGVSTSVAGNSTWGKYNVDFTLTEETAVTIAFNVKQTQTVENVAAFDNFKLGYLADVVKVTLQEEIANAESLLADASKTEGREVFAAAIETAKALRTSDDVAAINAGIETLKAAELAFRVANLPVQEGTYYVYNAYAKKFLSRGDNYGVRAVADDFGLPFNVTVDMTNTTYKLQMYDSKGYYGDDYWMYSDCSGNRVRSYSLEKVDGGFYLHNSNRATAADNRMYVYMKDDADKWAIAGNAIVGDNVGDEAQTVWQFVTAEQRNAIIAANAAAQKTAAFTAAGIAEDATLEVADATELTFKTGSAWIYTAGPNKGGTPGVNDNGTELYQATGNFAQTVENLESGLYKVSIQAFYRGGGNGDVVAAYGQGHDLSTVSLYANGTVIRVNSWAADRAADNNPNSMGDAAALFAEGKYLAEGYAFVGEDKTLSLKVFVPSYIGAGWFIASNVKYAKVDEAVLAGDANLNGEVTASDAILAVSFALETETPSPKAFKAADVNASGNITVSDAVGIVNIALSEVTSEPSARGDVAENNALALNGNVLALANTTEFVAFQMDVTVAEGTQFRGVELTSRAAGLNVSYNRVADNTYRVVAFSVNKNAIEAGEGAICTFDIVGNKNVQVTNIEFADAAARAYALVLGETTRINGIAAGAAGAEYYSVGGVKSDKVQKGMNVVRTADGKVKKVLVK